MAEQESELMVDRENYLAQGVHLGTRSQHTHMEDYIFHVKKNQLAVLNLEKTDEKIREAAEFLNGFEKDDILVVGRTEEAYRPINKFAEATGVEYIAGRFIPGTLTNPQAEAFREPEVVVVANPEEDSQAVKEASDINIPVVGIADSENNLTDIDHVIPANNKSESSLGLVFYLLADTMENGIEIEDKEFGVQEVEEEAEEETEQEVSEDSKESEDSEESEDKDEE